MSQNEQFYGNLASSQIMRDEESKLQNQNADVEMQDDEDQNDNEQLNGQSQPQNNSSGKAKDAQNLTYEEMRDVYRESIEHEIQAKEDRIEQLELMIEEKWEEKSDEIFQFRALLKSRSNIFLHGPNGSGKTTFTRDCIDI